jgi:hypothetical protein
VEVKMIRTGLAVLAGALLAAGAAAQSQTTTQAPAATPNATAQANPNANSPLPNGTAMNAELSSSVDSKKAKVGDKVEAHATEAVVINGQTLIPKGAKVEGHVTEATARSKGDNGSTLAIQFDKATPKNGEAIPLNVLVMAVAAPPRFSPDMTPGTGSDPMADRGAAAAGGSPMGSAGHGPPPNATSPNSSTDSVPSGVAAGQQAPGSNGPLSASARGVYGLGDLKLMEGTSSAGQTTVLTSTGKNIHLDGGTRLLLVAQGQATAAAAAPSK